MTDTNLSMLLTPPQRSELTLLIANATKYMRSHICDGFDIPASTASLPIAAVSPPLQPQTSGQITLTENVTPPRVSCDKLQAKLDTLEQMERRASSPKSPPPSATEKKEPSEALKKLRKDTLKSFDDWCEAVLRRVGEVINDESKEISGKRPAPPEIKEEDEDKEGLEFLQKHYGGVQTPTLHETGYGQLIVQSLLLLLLSLEAYDARSRVLLLHVSATLLVPLSVVITFENTTARGLVTAALSGDAESAKRVEASKNNKRWKVGLASLGGAVLIGVTGGLAAPFVAAGIGTILGGLGLGATAAAGLLGAVAGSSTIVGALFGAYGGRMTGQMVERYAAEVEDFKFLPLDPSPHAPTRLRVSIGITGWVLGTTTPDHDPVLDPWRSLSSLHTATTAYALRWELAALRDLGESMQTIFTDAAFALAGREILLRTVFATLYAALWPIALLKAARVIDNPFSIARHRSDKAGVVLADTLINRAQGERPVTLVGFSLGARVVWTCLQELAHRGAFGLVENVVLMGAPVPADEESWKRARAVVAGRLVNAYSSSDYVLAFLYRTASIQLGVAGLQEIGVEGVESVNLGKSVEGHLKYRLKVGGILQGVLRGDVEKEEVEKEEEVVWNLEREENKEKARVEQEGADDKGLDETLERAERRLEEMRMGREKGKGQGRARGGRGERIGRVEVQRKEVPRKEVQRKEVSKKEIPKKEEVKKEEEEEEELLIRF